MYQPYEFSRAESLDDNHHALEYGLAERGRSVDCRRDPRMFRYHAALALIYWTSDAVLVASAV
jgi:hypothetical protein